MICSATELLLSEVELLPPEAGLVPPEAVVHRLECESSLQKSFSVKEKCKYILTVDVHALIAGGLSCCQACSMIGLPQNYYAHFKKVIIKLDDFKQEPRVVSFKTNGTPHKIHPGHPIISQVIQEDLSRFVIEMKQHGIQDSTGMICQEACRLLPSFRIDGHNEKDCHPLHQNNGDVPSCCYSHSTDELPGDRRRIPTFHGNDKR
jgi:hypothetical protein